MSWTKTDRREVKRRQGMVVIPFIIILFLGLPLPFSLAAKDKIGLDLEWRPIKGVERPPAPKEPPKPGPKPSDYEQGKPSLSVESNVSEAVVRVNGKELGVTPIRDRELAPGSYRVEVSREGYETYRETVTLRQRGKATIKAVLKLMVPSRGRLYVTTDPTDARIRILNIVPPFAQGMELDPGRYHVEVSSDGYKTRTEWLDLAAGEERRMEVKLAQMGPRIGEVWREPITGMEFVWLPGGCFQKGQTEEEKRYLIKEVGEEEYKKWYARELPRHEVCVGGFWMGRTEVTVAAWRAFVKDTGYKSEAETGGGAYTLTGSKWEKKEGTYWDNPGFSQTDNHPVTCVSWNDAKRFIEWLGKKSGKSLRLPTEAEWEYACRGGTTTMRFWGDGEKEACVYANVADKTKHGQLTFSYAFECEDGYFWTAPVGSFRQNPLGLYDMLGNVWEWCGDWHEKYSSGSLKNPKGPDGGSFRVIRGGSWGYGPGVVRCANRGYDLPVNRYNDLGFRLVRTH
jgi:formylglycine-generating enzyme required for sulfatase activity